MFNFELRHIDRKAFDRKQLIHSPDLVNSLSKCNVHLSTRDPHGINNMIRGQPRLEMISYRAHLSTTENPCVIYEHGASFCSLLIAADSQGNIVSLHKPLVTGTRELLEQRLQESGFMNYLTEKIGPDRTFFVTATGTNVSSQQRLDLIHNLENIFGCSVNFLFLNKIEDDKKTTRLQKAIKKLTRTNDRLDLIANIFIIPSYASASNQTEVIIPYMPQATGEIQKNALKKVVNELKQRLQYNEIS